MNSGARLEGAGLDITPSTDRSIKKECVQEALSVLETKAKEVQSS